MEGASKAAERKMSGVGFNNSMWLLLMKKAWTLKKKDKILCFQPLYSLLNFLDFNNIGKPKIKFQILVAHTQNHLLWSQILQRT